MQIRVYYEDTDAGGVVYHTNYLKFCERARSEFFFDRGFSPQTENGLFVVKKIEANFIKSATLGDLVVVESNILDFGGASFTLQQNILLGDEVIFSAIIKLVFIKSAKPTKIPKDIKEFILKVIDNHKG